MHDLDDDDDECQLVATSRIYAASFQGHAIKMRTGGHASSRRSRVLIVAQFDRTPIPYLLRVPVYFNRVFVSLFLSLFLLPSLRLFLRP